MNTCLLVAVGLFAVVAANDFSAHCPALPVADRPAKCLYYDQSCLRDYDCRRGEVCCPYECGTTCRKVPVIEPPSIDCPPVDPDVRCIRHHDQCQSASECRPDTLCCPGPCGNVCADKPKSNPRCPAPESFGLQCFTYFNQCYSDEDCGKGQSCCLAAGCGHNCFRLP